MPERNTADEQSAEQPWLVLIGGSAGSFDPLRTILSDLDFSLPMSVMICTHRSENHSATPYLDLLSRCSAQEVLETSDGMIIQQGRIYVARAGIHLRIDDGRIVEEMGPRSRFWRPSIDDILVTVAENYGPRTVAVILSGAMDDGIEGIVRVWEKGGHAIVQMPSDAQQPSMPVNAILRDHPEVVAPADKIAQAIENIVSSNMSAGN